MCILSLFIDLSLSLDVLVTLVTHQQLSHSLIPVSSAFLCCFFSSLTEYGLFKSAAAVSRQIQI